MDDRRREVLKAGGGMTLLSLVAAAGWLGPREALAADWNKSAFEAKTVEDTVKALGGSAPARRGSIPRAR